MVPYVLKLWRGFNGNLSNFEYDQHYYLFKPDRSEQGMLWFTHPYINHYNPIEYAQNHGDWFFEYKLPVKKHIQINYWDDNSKNETLPDYWHKLAEPTRNSQYYYGIELPDGWVFSYKTEKFAGCKHALKILKSTVKASTTTSDH